MEGHLRPRGQQGRRCELLWPDTGKVNRSQRSHWGPTAMLSLTETDSWLSIRGPQRREVQYWVKWGIWGAACSFKGVTIGKLSGPRRFWICSAAVVESYLHLSHWHRGSVARSISFLIVAASRPCSLTLTEQTTLSSL